MYLYPFVLHDSHFFFSFPKDWGARGVIGDTEKNTTQDIKTEH
jgi:hypothetical protein